MHVLDLRPRYEARCLCCLCFCGLLDRRNNLRVLNRSNSAPAEVGAADKYKEITFTVKKSCCCRLSGCRSARKQYLFADNTVLLPKDPATCSLWMKHLGMTAPPPTRTEHRRVSIIHFPDIALDVRVQNSKAGSNMELKFEGLKERAVPSQSPGAAMASSEYYYPHTSRGVASYRSRLQRRRKPQCIVNVRSPSMKASRTADPRERSLPPRRGPGGVGLGVPGHVITSAHHLELLIRNVEHHAQVCDGLLQASAVQPDRTGSTGRGAGSGNSSTNSHSHSTSDSHRSRKSCYTPKKRRCAWKTAGELPWPPVCPPTQIWMTQAWHKQTTWRRRWRLRLKQTMRLPTVSHCSGHWEWGRTKEWVRNSALTV